MTINVNVHVYCPRVVTSDDLEALESRLMSALSDKIAEVTKAVDDATARVQADVAQLNARIADLQAKVDSGTATQADIDALDALEAKVAAIDPTKPDTLPEAGD